MTGILLGASVAGIAYATGASPYWSAGIGAAAAVLVWAVDHLLNHRR